jgi:hypothetical protein
VSLFIAAGLGLAPVLSGPAVSTGINPAHAVYFGQGVYSISERCFAYADEKFYFL